MSAWPACIGVVGQAKRGGPKGGRSGKMGGSWMDNRRKVGGKWVPMGWQTRHFFPGKKWRGQLW